MNTREPGERRLLRRLSDGRLRAVRCTWTVGVVRGDRSYACDASVLRVGEVCEVGWFGYMEPFQVVR